MLDRSDRAEATSNLAQFARYLAQGFEATTLITLGSGNGGLAVSTQAGLREVVVDDAQIADLRQSPCQPLDGGASRFESDAEPLPSAEVLRSAVALAIVGADRLAGLGNYIDALKLILADAPVAVLAVAAGESPSSAAELATMLEARGMPPTFVGRAPVGAFDHSREGVVAVVERDGPPPPTLAPSGFRVVAFMRSYNEEDIIYHSIRAVVEQGIEVYLLDGWSTDATVERAERWLGQGLIAVERFPPEGPSRYHIQLALFRRIERLAAEIDADWFIHHDADERRMSPWTGVGLRDGLYHVDRRGFNCVDHTIVEFPPTSDAFDQERDFAAQLRHFRFPIDDPANFLQRKAWKNPGAPVSLAATAGHDVTFQGRRVFPFKFLLRHYPFRSQAHGEHKIVRDRRPRVSPVEAVRGWSTAYSRYPEGQRFLVNETELEPYDEAAFNEKYLVERLSGIGIYERVRRELGGNPVPRWRTLTTRLPWSPASIAAELVREPQMDPICPAPAEAAIRWSTGDGSTGAVYVSGYAPPEQLFAQGPDGLQIADWIQPNTPYRFRLYAGTARAALLAEVEVMCEM